MPAHRKTTAQKRLEGTDRQHPERANLREPQYRAEAPPMPEWLPVAARPMWDRLVAEMSTARTLATTDDGALAGYCVLGALVADLSRRMDHGDLFLDQEKCKYPLAVLLVAAVGAQRSQGGELGLSPASRSKVSAIPEPEGESTLDRLLAKKSRETAAQHKDSPN